MSQVQKKTFQAGNLIAFINDKLSKPDLTLSAVASGSGISISYLSEIMHQKKVPEITVCNALADYFDVPRSKILELAGWMEDAKDNEHLKLVKEMEETARKHPETSELIHAILEIGDPKERDRLLRVLRKSIK